MGLLTEPPVLIEAELRSERLSVSFEEWSQ